MCKISFIIICYNLEAYIDKAIRSVRQQSIDDIEIIIVDDGSIDNTKKIIESHKSEDSRIRTVYQNNSGAMDARKRGLREARGEYIQFIDGDDWADKDLAKNVYNVASKYNYDIVTFNFYDTYDDENKTEVIEDELYEHIQGNMFLDLLMKQKINHSLWNKMYKREILKRSKFENTISSSMGEDLAANVAIGILRPKVKMLKESYYYHYNRSLSLVNCISSRTLEITKSLDYIEFLLEENNFIEKYNKEFEALWFIHTYCVSLLLNSNVNEYSKVMYDIWKDKNIDIKNNELCRGYVKNNFSKKNIILKKAYDINFWFGFILVKLNNLVRKVV